MIPKVSSQRCNASAQTDFSVYHDTDCFDFTNDDIMVANAQLPKISYTEDMVEGVIRPLGIAPDGSVINHHIPRLFKRRTAPMIQNLIDQIDQDPKYKDEFVRQMASALIPGLNSEDYFSLYTHPIVLPYRTAEVSFTQNGSPDGPQLFTAIFSLDGTLTLSNDEKMYKCKIELWDRLSIDREVEVLKDDKLFGKMTILKPNPTEEEIEANRKVDCIEPVSFETTPPQLVKAFGFEHVEDFVDIIRADDTSFVDILLSVPSLTHKEANDLLAYLHTKKLLSPYIRSKVCALQLVDPTQPRPWPELLGRFMFLLDPKWTYANIPLLRNNDVMAIFRHVRDMKGGALYVLQTALNALDEIRVSDPFIFFWTLIFMSLLQNATLANPSHAMKLKEKMVQMWKELQKKAPESNTRKLTREIIDHVKNIRQFELASVIHEDELDFIQCVIRDHREEIFTISQQIPLRREESHPLYYPVVLALETAIVQAQHHEDFVSSESESVAGDYESTGSTSGSRSRSNTRGSARVVERSGDSESAYSESSAQSGSRRRRTNTASYTHSSTIDSENEIHSDASRSSRSSRKKGRSQYSESQYSDAPRQIDSLSSSTEHSSRRAAPALDSGNEYSTASSRRKAPELDSGAEYSTASSRSRHSTASKHSRTPTTGSGSLNSNPRSGTRTGTGTGTGTGSRTGTGTGSRTKTGTYSQQMSESGSEYSRSSARNQMMRGAQRNATPANDDYSDENEEEEYSDEPISQPVKKGTTEYRSTYSRSSRQNTQPEEYSDEDIEGDDLSHDEQGQQYSDEGEEEYEEYGYSD